MSTLFGQVVKVGGTKVLLIEDYINTDPPNIEKPLRLEPATSQRAPIWYSESKLSEARASHPKAPAFGVWQILLHNGLVDTDTNGLWAFDLEGPRWAYLYVEDGCAIRSGVALGDRIPALPMLSKQDATNIVVTEESLSPLKLPAKKAFLPIELAEADRKAARRRTIFTVIVAGATLITALAVNMFLADSHQKKVDAFNKAKLEVKKYQARLGELQLKLSPITQQDRARQELFLERITILAAYSDKLRSEKPLIIYGSNEVLGIDADGLIGSVPFPWSLDLDRTGKVTLSFSIDADGTEIEETPKTALIESQLGDDYAFRK